MALRFEASNGIISCRTDQIRASVLPRQAQGFPACGPLDATLALFQVGGKYIWVLFGGYFLLSICR
jgi:hypothetical protein